MVRPVEGPLELAPESLNRVRVRAVGFAVLPVVVSHLSVPRVDESGHGLVDGQFVRDEIDALGHVVVDMGHQAGHPHARDNRRVNLALPFHGTEHDGLARSDPPPLAATLPTADDRLIGLNLAREKCG